MFRFRYAAWLVLFLSSCHESQLDSAYVPRPASVCRTTCGLEAAEGDCESLQRFEDTYIESGARYVKGWDAAMVCRAFQGWLIFAHKGYTSDDARVCGYAPGAWHLDNPMLRSWCVLGYTDQDDRTVEIEDVDWWHGALAHELVHVVDLFNVGKTGHCKWPERGIMRLLRAVTGEEDTSSKSCAE